MAVLTFGTVINLSPIFYVGGNVLKFYPNVEGKTITLRRANEEQHGIMVKFWAAFYLYKKCWHRRNFF
jgi:hypothetical protein